MNKFNVGDLVWFKHSAHKVIMVFIVPSGHLYHIQTASGYINQADEADLMSDADYIGAHQPKPSIKSNKFNKHELVWLGHQNYIVDNCHCPTPLHPEWRYDLIAMGKPFQGLIDESLITSNADYHAMRNGAAFNAKNQVNSFNRASALNISIPVPEHSIESYKIYRGHTGVDHAKSKVTENHTGCECGAWRVKDSGHSHWCKNYAR